MKYKINKQHPIDERIFELEDTNGNEFLVDFYTGGAFEHPKGVDETPESWREWLGTFVGKTISIETILPHTYFSAGETYIN